MTLHRILFVDDEPNVLQGLERTLRFMREHWSMRFVGGAGQALQALSEEPFDAIVSDMRMPGMDGAELLTEVGRRYPAMLRVILSGYSEMEAILRTIGPAHQYLAKPCPPQILAAVIRRSLESRRLLRSDGLRGLVASLKNLPTPPATYFELLSYMDDKKASVTGVAEIVERDVAMTAELLKVTNSAYFAIPSRVTTPLQAARVLGFDTLRALILRIGIFRGFDGVAAMRHLIEEINRDSFKLARLARRLAKAEGFELRQLDEAYCAGMLSSIGALLLFDAMPDSFARVVAAIDAGADPLDAEIAAFGSTHYRLGAHLLGLWGFSETVVEAVALVGRPGLAPAAGLDLGGILHVARVLSGPFPAFAREGQAEHVGRLALDMDYLGAVSKVDRLPVWMAEAQRER